MKQIDEKWGYLIHFLVQYNGGVANSENLSGVVKGGNIRGFSVSNKARKQVKGVGANEMVVKDT